MRDVLKGLGKFLGITAVALAIIGGILYGFFIRVVEVGHNAMAPTMMLGDTVLVWRTQEFELGQAALCPHPSEPGRYVMGRVVGRPGQAVEIDRHGTLLIAGRPVPLDAHAPITFHDPETGRNEQMGWADETILSRDFRIFWNADSRFSRAMRSTQVRSGLFLLSDNRSYVGEDSRTFGTVEPSTCVGRVFMRATAAESPPAIGNGALDILH